MSDEEYPVSSAIYEDAVAQANREKSRGDRLATELENLQKVEREAEALAWWEGVNDQWKHRPIGARLIEFANPYRAKR